MQRDVVVVGSGVGGLTAAALAARAGLSVLVVEAHTVPGGMLHSFTREGYEFDPSVPVLADPPSFDRMLAYLELEGSVELLPLPDYFTVAIGDLRVHLPFGAEDFIETHVQAFPDAADGIRQFWGTCRTIHEQAHYAPFRVGVTNLGRVSEDMSTVLEHRNTTVGELLERTISSPEARALCGAAAVNLGLPPARLALQTFAQMIFAHVVHGAAVVKGGSERISDALVAGVQKHGGEVELETPAEAIVVRDGRVTAVDLADGRRVTTGWVVSNADPVVTSRLLGEENVDPRFARRLGRLRPSCSALVVFTVSEVDLHEQDAGHRTFYSREWDLDAAYDETIAGRAAYFAVRSPAVVDPSVSLHGEHQVVATVCAELEPPRPWPELKQERTESVVAALDELYPGLRQRLLYLDSATPPAIERFTNNHAGAIFAWENTPQQVGSRRPGRVPKIDGLALAGSWAAPGPGIVRAILSGRAAAEVVIADTRIAESVPRFMT